MSLRKSFQRPADISPKSHERIINNYSLCAYFYKLLSIISRPTVTRWIQALSFEDCLTVSQEELKIIVIVGFL